MSRLLPVARPGASGSTAAITCCASGIAPGAAISSSSSCSSSLASKCQLAMAIMPLPVAFRPISDLLHTLPRTKPNTSSRYASGMNNPANCATSDVAKSRIPSICLPQNASSKRSYTIKPGAMIKNWRVKRGSSMPSASAAVLLSNCQISKACSTQVLPVPVAIFRQYFGCACLACATSPIRLPASSATGAAC